MIKKVLAAAAMLSLTLPASAEALTWKEFWEPFTDDEVHVHHYHRDYYRRPLPRYCWRWRTFYYEPDEYGHRGYYKEKLVRVRCRRRYHVHPAF